MAKGMFRTLCEDCATRTGMFCGVSSVILEVTSSTRRAVTRRMGEEFLALFYLLNKEHDMSRKQHKIQLILTRGEEGEMAVVCSVYAQGCDWQKQSCA